MPGFDGTGPCGIGPMTGRGRGFCILRVPDEPDQPLNGFVGRAGWPMPSPAATPFELANLRAEARHLEAVLRTVRSRLEHLHADAPY